MIPPGTLLAVSTGYAYPGLYTRDVRGRPGDRMCSLPAGTVLLVLFDEGPASPRGPRKTMVMVLARGRIGWTWRDPQLMQRISR